MKLMDKVPTEVRDQATQLTNTAVVLLRKLMKSRDVTFDDVAQKMGSVKAADLKRWLEPPYEIDFEDVMVFWVVVQSIPAQPPALDSIVHGEHGRDRTRSEYLTEALADNQVHEISAGDVDGFIHRLAQSFESLAATEEIGHELLVEMAQRSGVDTRE